VRYLNPALVIIVSPSVETTKGRSRSSKDAKGKVVADESGMLLSVYTYFSEMSSVVPKL
jgi:predicted lipoprotein with Yx(FWY)xxD motif